MDDIVMDEVFRMDQPDNVPFDYKVNYEILLGRYNQVLVENKILAALNKNLMDMFDFLKTLATAQKGSAGGE